jgi:hypothetical protein
LCARDGLALEEGPLTEVLVERLMDAGGSGLRWSRRRSWVESLFRTRLTRVAERLEDAASAAGCAERVSSAAIAMRMGLPGRTSPSEVGDVSEALRATWVELLELADVMAHSLAVIAERDERRRLVAALRGGANPRTPTRTILRYIKQTHGVMDEGSLRELLADLDLHLLPGDRGLADRPSSRSPGHVTPIAGQGSGRAGRTPPNRASDAARPGATSNQMVWLRHSPGAFWRDGST